MRYAYLVGDDGRQHRYSVADDAWVTLPSYRLGRAHPTGGTTFSGVVRWGVVRDRVYALLEDGRLYRAYWTQTDLLWEPALLGGYSFLALGSPLAIFAYSINEVDGQVWILGGNGVILVYDIDLDSIVQTIAVPFVMPVIQITHLGLTWNRDATVWVALGSNNTGDREFYSYDLDTGVWTTLGTDAHLRPINLAYFNGMVWTSNPFGQLSRYDPVGATWTTVLEGVTGVSGSTYLTRLSDVQLGFVDNNVLKRASGTGVITSRAAPPANAILNTRDAGFFGVFDIAAGAPLPLTVYPTVVNLPKAFEMVEVPRCRGAAAVESVHATPTIDYTGKLVAVDGGALRTQIQDILVWLEGQIVLELLPGRLFYGRVKEHTLDPQWVGVNDTFVSFSFTVSIPDTLFTDYEGFQYHTP